MTISKIVLKVWTNDDSESMFKMHDRFLRQNSNKKFKFVQIGAWTSYGKNSVKFMDLLKYFVKNCNWILANPISYLNY